MQKLDAHKSLQLLAPRAPLLQRFRSRYLDVLASVYIYNEYRGYTSLDRVLTAVRALCPDDVHFIAQIEKHRADERKHYIMFKRYFEHRGQMPLTVGRACGHIDRFIEAIFGCTIDFLDTDAIVAARHDAGQYIAQESHRPIRSCFNENLQDNSER
jgi:hypothetical protein